MDSPQALLTVCVAADARGPWYEVYRGDRKVITRARLGLVLDGFGNEPASRVTNARRSAVDQSWEQPWGEQRIIHDRHAELRVTLVGGRRHAHRALRSHRSGVRRRLRFPLRIQPDSGHARGRDRRRAHRVPFGLRGRRLGCVVVPGAPSRSRRISLQARAPARGASRGNAADAAVTGPVPVDTRSRAGGLRQHEPAPHRGAHAQGRSHALVRRCAGSQARAFRHPVAHGTHRRHTDAARRLAHRAQPQRAQPHRRHFLDPHRQVRGCVVGDASQPFDLGQRRETRRQQRQREALHRLRGEAWPGRRAGRGLESRLGRRLDRQRQAFQFHRVVSGLRSADAGGVRA